MAPFRAIFRTHCSENRGFSRIESWPSFKAGGGGRHITLVVRHSSSLVGAGQGISRPRRGPLAQDFLVKMLGWRGDQQRDRLRRVRGGLCHTKVEPPPEFEVVDELDVHGPADVGYLSICPHPAGFRYLACRDDSSRAADRNEAPRGCRCRCDAQAPSARTELGLKGLDEHCPDPS